MRIWFICRRLVSRFGSRDGIEAEGIVEGRRTQTVAFVVAGVPVGAGDRPLERIRKPRRARPRGFFFRSYREEVIPLDGCRRMRGRGSAAIGAWLQCARALQIDAKDILAESEAHAIAETRRVASPERAAGIVDE